MKTLKQLIKLNNFDWASSGINGKNFSYNGRLNKEIKLFHFNRSISSEDAIKEMAKKGYEQANVYELLTWSKDNWNGKDSVVALGSVSRDLDGYRDVPCLWLGDNGRVLNLKWFGSVWAARYRFAVVKKAELALPNILEINGIKYKKI